MKRIAVLTSGGDAPGMNAAIRAAVVIPEVETDPHAPAAELRAAYTCGKAHALVVVAEGARNNAEALARLFVEHQDTIGFDPRVTTLGHVQRGGAPGAFDRLLATRLAAATGQLAQSKHGVLVGLLKGEITATTLAEVVAVKKPLDLGLLELARCCTWTLSTCSCCCCGSSADVGTRSAPLPTRLPPP